MCKTVQLRYERDQEDAAGLRNDEDDLRGSRASLAVISGAPLRNEDITDATAAKYIDGDTCIGSKYLGGDICSNITRPALMTVGRNEALQNEVLVRHTERMAADI